MTVSLLGRKVDCCIFNRKVASLELEFDVDELDVTRYPQLWDVTIVGPPWCPVWCRLVTVPTDPFTTSTSPTGPFLSK